MQFCEMRRKILLPSAIVLLCVYRNPCSREVSSLKAKKHLKFEQVNFCWHISSPSFKMVYCDWMKNEGSYCCRVTRLTFPQLFLPCHDGTRRCLIVWTKGHCVFILGQWKTSDFGGKDRSFPPLLFYRRGKLKILKIEHREWKWIQSV